MFKIYSFYSKNDIYEILNVPKEKQGGHWNKGHASFNNIHFIFANIDISGSGYGKEDEYDYNNSIDNSGNLDWVTEDNRSQNVPLMKHLIRENCPLIFIRDKDTPKDKWQFYGVGNKKEINGNNPVRIKWKIETLDSLDLEKKFKNGDVWGSIDPNIFIFTAGDKNARTHLEDSVSKSIKPDLINKYLSEQTISTINNGNNNFYAWGAVKGPRNISNWNDINEGDYVLTVYDKKYHYVSRVLAKTHNSELAEKIWGTTDDGNTWEYMYFLTRPKKVEIHISSLSNYLNKLYRGFTKISRQKIINNILEDYDNIDNFIEQSFSFSSEKTVKDLSEFTVPVVKENSREVSVRTNAAITGNKAEEIFKEKFKSIFTDAIKLEDTTDLHGKGYDFTIVQNNNKKIFIEIKGCKDDLQGIRMTENEWNVAKKYGDSYYLVIIYNISTDPKSQAIQNPAKNLNAIQKATVSITYHVGKNQLQ
tara:strand:+ start:1313 stop:2740 length:1428 start_codon:yes stop_codon:yes gene_type:complete